MHNNESVTAIEINNYLKKYNEDFTAKYFRTFAVNEKFIEILKSPTEETPTKMTQTQRKKKVKEILTEVSCLINNSPAIAKKSYLSPELVNLYIDQPKKFTTDILKNEFSPSVNFIKFLEALYK